MESENRETVQRTITSDWGAYLAGVKGAAYLEYRKNWNSCSDMAHPLQLNIELTSYCNLRCKMCHYNFMENKTSMQLVD